MTRLTRLTLRLRPALLCACGAAALMTTGAQAQGDCMDQIDALGAAAADAPQVVSDEAAFRDALRHAEGWYEQGDRGNCQGWLDEAERLLAEPGARDRLQVIDPRSGRETDASAGFTASADLTVSPALPATSEISELERSARRRLVGGPDTTLAEINARGASGQRRFAGGDHAYGARAAPAPSNRMEPAVTVKTVRFEPETAEITADIREAVKTAASARNGAGVIAVRGDSFDARFRARADRLIQALAEEGVSRSDIEVMWGRSYAGTPDRLDLAVTPAGRRY